MQSGLASAQSPWKAGRGPHAHASDEEARGGLALGAGCSRSATPVRLCAPGPLSLVVPSPSRWHGGADPRENYLACSSGGCPGGKFRVVPGTLLRVRHRVTEGSLRWRQKQGTAGDPGPGSHLTRTARHPGSSGIKSRDLTFPVSFLATSLDSAHGPFVAAWVVPPGTRRWPWVSGGKPGPQPQDRGAVTAP